jgi:hypothetical protein
VIARLVSLRDGYARWSDGREDWSRPRWAICPTIDGTAPLSRYRNGGPRGFGRPVSGKDPPDWHRRAIAYVAFVGGLPVEELEEVCAWYRSHRVGAYPGLAADLAAK